MNNESLSVSYDIRQITTPQLQLYLVNFKTSQNLGTGHKESDARLTFLKLLLKKLMASRIQESNVRGVQI